MKKQIRQILRISALLFAIVQISGTFCIAQTPKAQQSDVLEVHYWVSVKGDFKTEGEVGSGDPTIFYHINRQYEGAGKLVYLPRQNDPKAAVLYPQFKDPAANVHIKVDDSRKVVFDPVCEEVLSIEETWKAEVFSFIQADKKFPVPALLLINNEKLNYKTSFPILYNPNRNSKDIEHSKKEILKSASGTEKVKTFPIEYQSFVTHGYPAVKGFIENSSIIRTPDWSELQWDAESNIYSWSSEVLHPDEPLIRNVPESRDKIDIVIHYNLIKNPKS